MAGIRTHQFARTVVGAAGLTTVYTVPAGHRALIKWASITTFSAAGPYAYFTVESGTERFMFFYVGAQGNGVMHSTPAGLYAVAEAGDLVRVNLQSVPASGSSVGIGGVLFEI